MGSMTAMSSVEPRVTSRPALQPPSPGPEETIAQSLLDSPAAGPRALRGSSLRSAGYVISILLSLLAAPLLIRHLGNTGYGRYMVVIAIVAVIAGLTEGGLNATAVRRYANTSGARRARTMGDALGVRLILTTLGACAAVGFAAVAGYGAPLVIGTALASAGMVLQLVQGLYAVSLESELRLGWLTTVELLRQIVSVSLLVALIIAGAGIVPLLGVAVPASAASLLLTAWLVRGRIPLRPAFTHRGSWPALIRESIPWAAVAAANIVYFRLAIILTSLISNGAQTGYFATSLRVIEVLVGIPAVAVTAVYPILARTVHGDGERFSHASGRLFELALVVGVWMVLCLEIGAGFVIHVLAGNQADPAITVLRIQGPAVLATFLAVACGYPLLTLRRYRDAIAANLTALVISGALTSTLVGPLGARGAAIAALGAEFAMAALTVWFLHRAAPAMRLRAGTVAAIALAGGIATGLGLLAPVQPVIAAIIGSGLYFALLHLLGRLPPEVREILAKRTRPANR